VFVFVNLVFFIMKARTFP